MGVGWGGDRVWVPRTDEAVVMAFEPATGVWHSHTAPDASSVVRFTDAVLVDDEMALVSQGGKVWMTPLTGAGGEWVSVTSTMPFLADATSDGQLVMALAQDGPDGAPVALLWQNGAGASVDGLDLVATVDVDADGAAELAWLNGDSLEIWTAEGGLQQRL